MNEIVERYLATWNAERPARQALIAQHWARAATYTDPLAQVAGHAEIDALIEGVRAQFPGYVFTPVGDADGHHRLLRFRWGLGPRGAAPAVLGFDVLATDGQGRIADVRGFLDTVPG